MCASPLRTCKTLCQVVDLRTLCLAPEGHSHVELEAYDNNVCSRRSPCYMLSALTLRLEAFETGLMAF